MECWERTGEDEARSRLMIVVEEVARSDDDEVASYPGRTITSADVGIALLEAEEEEAESGKRFSVLSDIRSF